MWTQLVKTEGNPLALCNPLPLVGVREPLSEELAVLAGVGVGHPNHGLLLKADGVGPVLPVAQPVLSREGWLGGGQFNSFLSLGLPISSFNVLAYL